MAGELADEVRIFDLLVEVAYKCLPGKVGTGYICDTFLFVLAGDWVSDCHHSFYAGFVEYGFYGIVVVLLGDEREEFLSVRAFVFLYYGEGSVCEVHFHYIRVFVLCLGGDIFNVGAAFVCQNVVNSH